MPLYCSAFWLSLISHAVEKSSPRFALPLASAPKIVLLICCVSLYLLVELDEQLVSFGTSQAFSEVHHRGRMMRMLVFEFLRCSCPEGSISPIIKPHPFEFGI